MSFFWTAFRFHFCLWFSEILVTNFFFFYILAWGLQYYFSLCLAYFIIFFENFISISWNLALPFFFLEFNYMCVRTFHYVSFSFVIFPLFFIFFSLLVLGRIFLLTYLLYRSLILPTAKCLCHCLNPPVESPMDSRAQGYSPQGH